MMLDCVGHSTQQNHVRASVMVKVRNVLNSFSWFAGRHGCDLRKVKTENQIKIVPFYFSFLSIFRFCRTYLYVCNDCAR